MFAKTPKDYTGWNPRMQTLIALQDILIKAIPTFLLVWVLYFYVSRGFLAHLQKTLRQRKDATEGLREAAAQRISLAEQKTAAYQEALRSNAAEIYRQQEEDRQKALEQRAEILRQARQKAEERIRSARQEILRDTEEAKQALRRESEQMARWIAQVILEPPAVAIPRASAPASNPGASQ